jgi:hypothetical protein
MVHPFFLEARLVFFNGKCEHRPKRSAAETWRNRQQQHHDRRRRRRHRNHYDAVTTTAELISSAQALTSRRISA